MSQCCRSTKDGSLTTPVSSPLLTPTLRPALFTSSAAEHRCRLYLQPLPKRPPWLHFCRLLCSRSEQIGRYSVWLGVISRIDVSLCSAFSTLGLHFGLRHCNWSIRRCGGLKWKFWKVSGLRFVLFLKLCCIVTVQQLTTFSRHFHPWSHAASMVKKNNDNFGTMNN